MVTQKTLKKKKKKFGESKLYKILRIHAVKIRLLQAAKLGGIQEA